MPHPYFFRLLVILSLTQIAANAHGAEWRECEKAKLRQLELQRPASDAKTTKHKRGRRGVDRHQRVEDIDTWLWKNCREYSYELRQLEQEKM